MKRCPETAKPNLFFEIAHTQFISKELVKWRQSNKDDLNFKLISCFYIRFCKIYTPDLTESAEQILQNYRQSDFSKN